MLWIKFHVFCVLVLSGSDGAGMEQVWIDCVDSFVNSQEREGGGREGREDSRKLIQDFKRGEREILMGL